MMKKIYIQPQTNVELAQCEMLVATGKFEIDNSGSQSVSFTDDEYDDEFTVKEYSFGDDF